MTTARNPRVLIYRDEPGSGRWIRQLGDPARAVIVADVFDHTKAALFDFAEAVLDGLGKDQAVYRIKRRCEPLAAAWVHTLSPLTVIVPDAQLIDADKAADAASWLAGLGADVWLCCAVRSPQRLPLAWRQLAEELGDTDVPEVLDAELVDAAYGPPRSTPAIEGDPWPRVPRVDGVMFRSACQRLLSPTDAGRVDVEFVRLVTLLHDRIPDPELGGVQKRQVWRVLADALDSAESVEHVIITVRAAQVACLLRGWHLAVDGYLLIGAAHVRPRLGQLEAEGIWETLDAYRDPDPGAVAALYLGGVDAEFIQDMRLRDVDDTDGVVLIHTDQGTVELTNGGARYVRTLLAARVFSGGRPDDHLLVNHRTAGLSKKMFTKLLQVPATEVGVAITHGRVPASHPSAGRQVSRYGLELSYIADVRQINRRKAG